MTYAPAIRHHSTNTVALTGYQVEGTPGRSLLDTGSVELDGRMMLVSAQVELHEFSAHADREGFLERYRESEVLLNHGDRCGTFAEEPRGDGYETRAPALGGALTV